jgi:hypothetical protein
MKSAWDSNQKLSPCFANSDVLPLNHKSHLLEQVKISVQVIDYLRFYVPLKNFALICRRHYCRWRAAKFRPMLGAQGLWSGRGLYRATPAVTRDLRLYGLIRRTSTHIPQWEADNEMKLGMFVYNDELQISVSSLLINIWPSYDPWN